MRSAIILILAPLLVAVGCHESQPATAPDVPAIAVKRNTSSQPTVKTYVDTVSGISFEYPAEWAQGRGKTALFEADSPDHTAKLSLDVPSLPFHLPGMITPGAVANGYINDFKKQFSGATVQQNDVETVPNGSARRVQITLSSGGKATTDIAVCIVHADKVFIVSSDGTGAGVDTAKTAIDSAVRSIRWSK